MTESDLLARITVNPAIFGGKPIIRGRRMAVEHVLGILAAGDSAEAVLEAYSWRRPVSPSRTDLSLGSGSSPSSMPHEVAA